MNKLLVLVVAHGLLLTGTALAQQSSPDQNMSVEDEGRARRIAGQLMSPFCPGRTLNECPSPSATEWRQDIREWVAEGVSAPEIRRRLEARVPDADLTGNPGAEEGTSPLLWIALVALAIPAAILLPLVRKRRRRGAGATKDQPEEQSPAERTELDNQLDRELEALDG